MVDSTAATPVLSRPLELGADIVMHAATKAINETLQATRKQLAEARAAVPKIPVMRELSEKKRKRETRIHNRGNFLDPGDSVDSAVCPWPSAACRRATRSIWAS